MRLTASSDSRMDSSAGSSVQAGGQDDADGDDERPGQVGVEGEAREQQGQRRGDDGGGGRADRLPHPGDRPDDGVARVLPGMRQVSQRAAACPGPAGEVVAAGVVPADPQFLPDPEDQEQPVVRTRADDQHDQQQLRDRRDLQAVLGRLGDQRSRDRDRDRGGQHRGDSEREGAEDQHEQHDHEQHRQALHLVAGVTRCLLLVDLDRQVAGQVRVQAGRQPGGRDLRAERIDKVLGVVGIPAAGDVGQRHQLDGLAVAGPTLVDDLGDARDLASRACRELIVALSALVSEPPVVATTTGIGCLFAVPNGLARSAAWELGRIRRQELLVVALGDAGQ